MIRLLAGVTASLIWLSAPSTIAQTVPLNGVPLITEVTPPSISPATTDPRLGIIHSLF